MMYTGIPRAIKMRAREDSRGSCQNGVINKYSDAMAMTMGTISQTCGKENTDNIGKSLQVYHTLFTYT